MIGYGFNHGLFNEIILKEKILRHNFKNGSNIFYEYILILKNIKRSFIDGSFESMKMVPSLYINIGNQILTRKFIDMSLNNTKYYKYIHYVNINMSNYICIKNSIRDSIFGYSHKYIYRAKSYRILNKNLGEIYIELYNSVKNSNDRYEKFINTYNDTSTIIKNQLAITNMPVSLNRPLLLPKYNDDISKEINKTILKYKNIYFLLKHEITDIITILAKIIMLLKMDKLDGLYRYIILTKNIEYLEQIFMSF